MVVRRVAYDNGGHLMTLDRFFEQAFDRYRERPAIRFCDQRYTYGELDDHTARLANAYRSLGLGADDRVGILMENRPEFIVAHIAAVRAGIPVVPLNSQLGAEEARTLIQLANLHTLLVDDAFFDVVRDFQRDTQALNYVIGYSERRSLPIGFHSFTEILDRADPGSPPTDTSPDDIAAIYFSSGTTGEPKGVMHAHRPLVLNSYAHIQELDVRRGERMLITTPLAHSAEPFTRAGLAQGATIFLHQAFDSERVLTAIQKEAISWTYLVPTMIATLVDDPLAADRDVASLSTLAYGAAPIPKPILENGLERFGEVFVQFYGLTEVPNLISVLPKADHDSDDETALNSAGYPTQLVEVSVRELDTQWANDVGEICVRSPCSFVGYTTDQPRTDDEGWFRTGDVGYLDSVGRVHVLDRLEDVIVRDGKPVYSSTVESTIQRHQEIKQIGVIGIPRNGHADDPPDQLVKAVVVPSNGQRIELDDLQAVCRDHLGQELPDSIDIVGQLPETPYGKIDKKALRDPYW